MRLRLISPLIGLAALAACGQVSDLRPAKGHELPMAPYGSDERAHPSALMQPRPQAAPQRTVELRLKSEDRQDDPFDLPPKD